MAENDFHPTKHLHYFHTLCIGGILALIIILGTMVSTMAWNDNCNMLAAVADNKLTIWYYPNVAFVDPDIVQKTLLQLDQK